jgi:hypothetical protein
MFYLVLFHEVVEVDDSRVERQNLHGVLLGTAIAGGYRMRMGNTMFHELSEFPQFLYGRCREERAQVEQQGR